MGRLRGIVIVLSIVLGLLPTSGLSASTVQKIPLPPGWKQTTWEGVVVSYDPRRYVLASGTPDDRRARVQASIAQSPNPCTTRSAGCSADTARLQLFPGGGMDVRTWVTRNYASLVVQYSDTVIADRQAIKHVENAGVSGERVTFIIPVGTEMLVIDGSLSTELAGRLAFSRPAPAVLAVGQPAITSPGRAWDLWTAATGGARVVERPRLYGGTLLTIVAMTPKAVMVRTSDDVAGWIHAPAVSALTTNVLMPGERARFEGSSMVQVELRSRVPLRRSPRSTAPKLLEQLVFGQKAMLLGVRGDWARVMYVDDARRAQTGWARWHEDGARYLSFTRR